jgi:hypothetical protein
MSLLISSDCLPHQVRQAMTGGFEDKEIAVQELSHAESLTEEALLIRWQLLGSSAVLGSSAGAEEGAGASSGASGGGASGGGGGGGGSSSERSDAPTADTEDDFVAAVRQALGAKPSAALAPHGALAPPPLPTESSADARLPPGTTVASAKAAPSPPPAPPPPASGQSAVIVRRGGTSCASNEMEHLMAPNDV